MIKSLDKKTYKGHKMIFRYTSDNYYDVIVNDNQDCFTFSLVKKPFETRVQKSFTSTLFEPYLDTPSAFGYVIDDTIVGYIEVNKESWHNVLRVTNILVEDVYRRQGIGKALMDYIKTVAEDDQCRLIMLETQTCNSKAIEFYRKEGFKLVGLNTADYTNQDIEKSEVRLEFGFKIKTQ